MQLLTLIANSQLCLSGVKLSHLMIRVSLLDELNTILDGKHLHRTNNYEKMLLKNHDIPY